MTMPCHALTLTTTRKSSRSHFSLKPWNDFPLLGKPNPAWPLSVPCLEYLFTQHSSFIARIYKQWIKYNLCLHLILINHSNIIPQNIHPTFHRTCNRISQIPHALSSQSFGPFPSWNMSPQFCEMSCEGSSPEWLWSISTSQLSYLGASLISTSK